MDFCHLFNGLYTQQPVQVFFFWVHHVVWLGPMATGLREVLLCKSMGPSILMLMGYEKYYFLFSVARCMKSGLTGFSKLARPTFLGFQIDLFLNRFFVVGNREKNLKLFPTETILSVYERVMFDCSIQHQLIKTHQFVTSPPLIRFWQCFMWGCRSQYYIHVTDTCAPSRWGIRESVPMKDRINISLIGL